jgi:DMSO/TMAO reductase YedYZ molybdopterin-dependent catalytic subunit
MPPSHWYHDDVPQHDRAASPVMDGRRQWAIDELDEFDDDLTATLDCTGGWYATQVWRGVRLDRLLRESGADGDQSIDVRSVTGYWRRFPASDARNLLLATRAGDEPLSRGHGAPARLVAPGRRGFWWVKWVASIEPSGRPWWWQPPFPLS